MTPAAALLTGAAASLSLLLIPAAAAAGAWTQPKGRAQAIVKYEDMRADRAFDPDGRRVDLVQPRLDRSLGLFAEYGVTDRLTLQTKADWQDGREQFADYRGRGPVEVALVWQAWRNDHGAVSVQAGYAAPGEGRNAGYEAPGLGGGDWEARISGGWSFNGPAPRRRWQGWLVPRRSFVEVQAARRIRGGLADETRVDLTLGRHIGRHWLVLNQTYAGQTDGRGADGRGGDGRGARWVKSETSVVRTLGSWSVQAGWRASTAGRETPVSHGPVIAIWKRF